MRSYASISPTFWTRGTGKRLRGHKEAQLVALYLMSAPATSMVGVYHLALPTLCHETGLSSEDAIKGLARCLEEGFAFWDDAEELVFVPALAKHQLGEKLKEKDHKVKGVIRALAPFKGHRFYSMFIERYADSYQLHDEPDEAPSKSLARDDVPVLSCPVPDPVSSPGSGSPPQVDSPRVDATDTQPPKPRDVQAMAKRFLADPTRAALELGRVEQWPEVVAVCKAFQDTWGRSDAPRHGADPRARVIVERMAEGFSVLQLQAALRGSKFADYIKGNQAHQALKTILRDAGQIDKFSALTALPSKPGDPKPKQPNGGAWRPEVERE